MGHNKLACWVKKGFEWLGYGFLGLTILGLINFMGLLVGTIIVNDPRPTVLYCYLVGAPYVYGFIGGAYVLYRLYEWADDNC